MVQSQACEASQMKRQYFTHKKLSIDYRYPQRLKDDTNSSGLMACITLILLPINQGKIVTTSSCDNPYDKQANQLPGRESQNVVRVTAQ